MTKIAEVAFTSADRVRDVIHNFNTDGFDSLYPRYAGGRPKTFTLPERREIKKTAKSVPTEHDLPFSTWSLSKLAEFLVAEGVVDDISHEGLRVLLREEGVSFQKVISCGAAAFSVRHTPLRLTSMVSSQSSSVRSHNAPRVQIPWLITTMSMLPNVSTVSATAASSAAEDRASTLCAATRTPSAATDFAAKVRSSTVARPY